MEKRDPGTCAGTRSCAAGAGSVARPPTSWPSPGRRSSCATPTRERLEDCPYLHLDGDATRDEFLRRVGSRACEGPRGHPGHRRLQPVRHADRPGAEPRTWSSSPAAASTTPSRSCCAPAPIGWSTRSGSAATASRRSRCSRTSPTSSTWRCTTRRSSSASSRWWSTRARRWPGSSVRQTRLHEGDGALLLALRQSEGGVFRTNPSPGRGREAR